MKKILLLLLLFVSSIAVAQNKTYISTQAVDNMFITQYNEECGNNKALRGYKISAVDTRQQTVDIYIDLDTPQSTAHYAVATADTIIRFVFDGKHANDWSLYNAYLYSMLNKEQVTHIKDLSKVAYAAKLDYIIFKEHCR